MAIAEAYRRKKRHEEKKKIRLRKEVHRPRNSKVEKTTGEKSQQKLEAHKVYTCSVLIHTIIILILLLLDVGRALQAVCKISSCAH